MEDTASNTKQKSVSYGVTRISVGMLVTLLFFSALFYTAGGVSWLKGWLYILLLTVGQAGMLIVVAQRNPELIRRRASFGAGTKRWDYVVGSIFGLTCISVLIVAALDHRNSWSSLDSWIWWAVGLILFAFYIAIFTWSMIVNPHFEKTVRIQTEYNHQVIDTGPYRFVRHPGYLGVIFGLILASPLLLASVTAFIPAAVSVISLIIRTALEDKTLRDELPGYSEYMEKVRYRLIPGLW